MLLYYPKKNLEFWVRGFQHFILDTVTLVYMENIYGAKQDKIHMLYSRVLNWPKNTQQTIWLVLSVVQMQTAVGRWADGTYFFLEKESQKKLNGCF